MAKNIVRNQKVSHDKLELSRQFRKEMTDAEKMFWSVSRNRQIDGLKFRRQQVIDGFIVDFYCDELGLCVEIDGGIHDNLEQKKYDIERTRVLNERDLKVLRFKNNDIMNNIDDVINEIIELKRLG